MKYFLEVRSIPIFPFPLLAPADASATKCFFWDPASRLPQFQSLQIPISRFQKRQKASKSHPKGECLFGAKIFKLYSKKCRSMQTTLQPTTTVEDAHSGTFKQRALFPPSPPPPSDCPSSRDSNNLGLKDRENATKSPPQTNFQNHKGFRTGIARRRRVNIQLVVLS